MNGRQIDATTSRVIERMTAKWRGCGDPTVPRAFASGAGSRWLSRQGSTRPCFYAVRVLSGNSTWPQSIPDSVDYHLELHTTRHNICGINQTKTTQRTEHCTIGSGGRQRDMTRGDWQVMYLTACHVNPSAATGGTNYPNHSLPR